MAFMSDEGGSDCFGIGVVRDGWEVLLHGILAWWSIRPSIQIEQCSGIAVALATNNNIRDLTIPLPLF
jgi:hypothetical protein